MKQHILKEKLKKLAIKKRALEYEAAVWGSEMPTIKVEDTPAACKQRADVAKEVLDTVPELVLDESDNDEDVIKAAVEAEATVRFVYEILNVS